MGITKGRNMLKYITKYWATKGVLIADVSACHAEGLDRLEEKWASWFKYVPQRESFDSLEMAQGYVAKQKAKKIAALRRQIERLEKLEIPVIDSRGLTLEGLDEVCRKKKASNGS